jgi:hypothetical protein
MAFSLVTHLILENFMCSILKLTKSWRQLVSECAGDDEIGEEIFQEEEHEHGDDEDGGVVPMVEYIPTTSTTVENGPSPTPITINPNQGEAAIEGEVASR